MRVAHLPCLDGDLVSNQKGLGYFTIEGTSVLGTCKQCIKPLWIAIRKTTAMQLGASCYVDIANTSLGAGCKCYRTDILAEVAQFNLKLLICYTPFTSFLGTCQKTDCCCLASANTVPPHQGRINVCSGPDSIMQLE